MTMTSAVRLWVLLMRSRLRPGAKKYETLAREVSQRASDLAASIMAREWAALEAAGIAHLFNDETMHSIEIQFLWGVFHELAQEYPNLPTHVVARTQFHLIQHLMTAHGYSFERARDEANAVEDLYNKADVLFDMAADIGKDVFHGRIAGGLAFIVQGLHKTGMSADAYR